MGSVVRNNCRFFAGSQRVTYDLLRYSTIFMQRYGRFITISLRVFLTTVRQCASFCVFSSCYVRVQARSPKSLMNGNGMAVKHSFSTHNYPWWISTAIHTRTNNLIHILWIYINLLINHCSQDENQSALVCQGHAHLSDIPHLHSRGRNTYELMKLAFCCAKSNECRTLSY